MKKTVIAFMAIVTLATVGCKKENENETQAVTKENVAGSYKIAAVKVQVGGTSSEIDITNSYVDEDCEKDDLYQLNADLSFGYVDAGMKCSPAGDYSGSWKVVNNNTIEIDGQALTVKSLTKAQMVTTFSEEYNGTQATYTMTMAKQ